MLGTVLGFDATSNTGIISAKDGDRYNFTHQAWKEDNAPQKGMSVDFDTSAEGDAKDIYVVKNKVVEQNETIMGIVSILITFFLGFIGTFISRLVLSKEPIGATIIPTLIHFVITLLVMVPIVGWLIYIIGTGYYMYTNYKRTIDASQRV